MPSKREILIESIRKLLSLKVPPEEIVVNLAEVGVSKPEALVLIKEAKRSRGKSQPKSREEEKGKKQKPRPLPRRIQRQMEWQPPASKRSESVLKKLEEKRKQELAMEKFGEGKLKLAEKKAVEKLGKKPASLEERREQAAEQMAAEAVDFVEDKALKTDEIVKDIGPKEEFEEEPKAVQPEPAVEEKAESTEISKLWEKGILTTVNSKLREMKRLKEELDAVLDEKIDAAAKRELGKIKLLFDSQRTLLVSKVDAEIEAKANAFAEMIEAKLQGMKETSKETEALLEKLRAEKQSMKEEEASIGERLQELDAIKQRLVADANAEMIKAKSQIEQFLSEAKKKLADMDDRINKTLQLESEIVEGLAKDAEAKIEQRLEGEAIGRLKKSLAKDIDARIEQRLQGKTPGLDPETIAQLKQFNSRRLELENEMREKLDSIEALQAAIKREFKPEQFAEQMKRLELFRNRLSASIEGNVENFNEAVKRFNETMKISERQINLRIEKIDRKLAELDAFEKNFAKEMGIALDKLKTKKSK